MKQEVFNDLDLVFEGVLVDLHCPFDGFHVVFLKSTTTSVHGVTKIDFEEPIPALKLLQLSGLEILPVIHTMHTVW